MHLPRPAVLDRTLHRPLAALTLGTALLATAACGPEAATSAATGQSDAAAPATRTVTHAMGTTEVPAQPQRVVTLDTGELDSALQLGVTPVGAVTTDVSEQFLSYLQDETAGVEVVGTIGEPDLEEIAALQPDLILSNVVRDEAVYDQLSAIAPTVMAADVGDTWKQNFLLAAEALGRTEEAEQALAEYEEHADALGTSLGDPAALTVSPLRFTGGGTVRAYRPESFLGTVLDDVGVSLPELPAGEVETFTELSPEELQLADGDVVLYSSYGAPAESGEQVVTAGPLWPRLQAVQADRAYRVEDDYFYTGIGLGAAELVLDDLEGILTGTP